MESSVKPILDDFIETAKRELGADLASIVLYGSAADDTMRASSDVNLIVVLERFDRAKVDALREALRFARATIRLKVMFLLAREVAPALSAFAVKFGDILHRRRVLHGSDPFAALAVPRDAAIARLRQVLLNLTIRLRETYVLRSLREEQLAPIIADCAGPLRAAAAAILELEGEAAVSPKEALARLAPSLGIDHHERTLARLSQAREERAFAPGEAGEELLALGALADALRARAERLTP